MALRSFVRSGVERFQLSRKDSSRGLNLTVPQTDTGGLVENTKAIEKTISKELGKTAGRKLCKMPFPRRRKAMGDAAKDSQATV